MSLQQHLYTQTTIPDVLTEYIQELSQKTDMQSMLHANKWISYRERMMDRNYIKGLRVFFNKIYNHLSKKYPELSFSIEGRRKSLVSVEQKILHYTQCGKSLDLIRDFFAFRIVLFGDTNLNLEKYCYRVTSDIIELGASNGFNPCDRAPLMDVKSLDNHSNDYFSDYPYRHYIKDYICFPKENGYQSIHLVLVDPKGRHLEIQVRNLEMHFHAEKVAVHTEYKGKKYAQEFSLDREKVKVKGYTYHTIEENGKTKGKYVDLAGIEDPLVVFQRQKTF